MRFLRGLPKPRIEFAGAFFHVMCRGGCGERIFEGDDDRQMFLRTLAEFCEKIGWWLHAWVLYCGSLQFREEMLKLVPCALGNRNYRASGPGRQKERKQAEFWIEAARKHFGVAGACMSEAPRSARLVAA